MRKEIVVKSGRSFTGSNQWGYRAIIVEDGGVLVWDDVAQAYTRCHALTPGQQARVRRLAGEASAAAAALGRVKSDRKTASCRENGKKGGRPKKVVRKIII